MNDARKALRAIPATQSKHYTCECELKINKNNPWLWIDLCWNIKVNYTKVDNYMTGQSKFEEALFFFTMKEGKTPTLVCKYTNVYIHPSTEMMKEKVQTWTSELCFSNCLWWSLFLFLFSSRQIPGPAVHDFACMQCSTWASPRAFDRPRWNYALLT